MAFGYNPRASTHWRGVRPSTRMGAYGMLEKYFEEVLRKESKRSLEKEKTLVELKQHHKEGTLASKRYVQLVGLAEHNYSIGLNADEVLTLQVLRGEVPVKVHVHKEDDIYYLLDLCKRYPLRVTIEHACDVHHQEVFESIRDSGISVVYGPIGSFAYKNEIRHDSYENVRFLVNSGVEFGLMTDHPVISSYLLRESLKAFLVAGLSEERALQVLTFDNARVLDMGDILGRVKAGYLASLLIWDRDPLHLAARPSVVLGEGVLLRNS